MWEKIKPELAVAIVIMAVALVGSMVARNEPLVLAEYFPHFAPESAKTRLKLKKLEELGNQMLKEYGDLEKDLEIQTTKLQYLLDEVKRRNSQRKKSEVEEAQDFYEKRAIESYGKTIREIRKRIVALKLASAEKAFMARELEAELKMQTIRERNEILVRKIDEAVPNTVAKK